MVHHSGRGLLVPLAIALVCLDLAASSAAPGARAAAAPSRNLLANPGFEIKRPGHPWMPAGWDTFPSGLPTVFFSRDTFMVHGGRYAVSVANLSTAIPMFH